MKHLVFFSGVLLLLGTLETKADEGMWLPYLLNEGIIDSMQAKGLALDAEDIFSSDTSSLKDAIVLFGGGCTGSFISKKGLVITNHHCALSSLEKLEKDNPGIIDSGYWSQSLSDEIPVPGLSVKLLNNVENVTDRFQKLSDNTLTEAERQDYIDSISTVIADDHPKGEHQKVSVEGFNYDQQFYLFEYTLHNDIRLVAAPPISIGKFGKDADNWKWPRHTGDFTVFRVYASPGNEASYHAEENKPLQPKKHLSISASGVRENDFVWLYGYPGRTFSYLPSQRIQQVQDKILPNRITIRELKLQALQEQIAGRPSGDDSLIARRARLSNILKKYKGITEGLEREDAINAKTELENRMVARLQQSGSLQQFQGLVDEINRAYQSYYPVYMANDYASQVFLGTELMELILRFYHKRVDDTAYMRNLNESVREFSESSNMETQTKLSKKLLMAYYQNIDPQYHPGHFSKVDAEYDGDLQQYINTIFEESVFTDKEDILKLMDMWTWRVKRKLQKDPLYQLTFDMGRTYWGSIRPEFRSHGFITDSLQRHYFNLQQSVFTDQLFYPNANRTLRVAYGQVKGYFPGDAVYYHWRTTVSGMVYKWEGGEKYYPKDNRLAQLIHNADYGTYFSAETPVCFISNTHTTGGNSGSPALNSKGEMVGLNFDRNWEGTMADYYYKSNVCRNIMVDIRYILFLLEKYGSSVYLFNELTIH